MKDWIKLGLNCKPEADIETFISKGNNLMLQNHFLSGWEIVPIKPESFNNFYFKFPDGISGDSMEQCLQKYSEKI